MKKTYVHLWGLVAVSALAQSGPNGSLPAAEQPTEAPAPTNPSLEAPLPPVAAPPPATDLNTPPASTGEPANPPAFVPPSAARPRRPAVVALTAPEMSELSEIEREFAHYQDAANENERQLATRVQRAFLRRTAELEKKYAAGLSGLETKRTALQGDARALLDRFVAEHPTHQQYTPDVMFRLADLELDVADVEVERLSETNPDAVADYRKSLALWEDILKRFPTYRQVPATLYLLGYYGKLNDERRSLQLFLALACANRYKYNDPPPRTLSREEAMARVADRTIRRPYDDCQPMPGADPELVRHAWVRGIADYHFSIPGELDEALSAYNKVANGGNDSSLYSEALYKLAWSNYKRDLLREAIERFDDSVKLYDAVVAAGEEPKLELREESVQYIAVAFTDPWQGETDSDPVKAFDRAREFYKGRENEPHVRDVWVAMGRAFVELQAWDQAVDAFRIAIGPPWELNARNPEVHQEIVNVFETKGDKFAADSAAGELATRYAPGSAWYVANEKDREAMDNQRRIAERALYAAARNTHAAATTLRREWEASNGTDAEMRSDFLALYAKASQLYQTFISQYPESDYIYEFTFLLGESLYFSERYLESVEHYRWVRDHRSLSEQYYLASARSILAAYEAEAERQAKAGLIQVIKVPTAAELKAFPQPYVAKPIPEIYKRLQTEWDDYQNRVNDPVSAPVHGINAALVSLAYLHIEDAETRLGKVMSKFCGNEQSIRAKDSLLSIYEATGQLDKFTRTNETFIATNCGDAASKALAISQNRSIEFRKSEELLTTGQYEPAAKQFYKFYRTANATDPDGPTALYNAGVAYKLANRPKTAIGLFREFADSTDKRFRESPYYLEAARQMALSYQGAFDYKNALVAWLDLVETTKSAQRRGIKPPPPIGDEAPRTLQDIGLEAMYQAALVAELDRNNNRAVELYGKYEREEPDRRKKDRALWAIARLYRSAGDSNAMTEAYDRWRQKYGKTPGNEADYVATYYDVATLQMRKGRTTAAEKAGKETIAAWRATGAPKGTKGAEMAAEWGVYFSEQRFRKFLGYALTDRARTMDDAKRQKTKLLGETTAVQDVLKALDEYGVVAASMAAKVRYGETLSLYAEKLLAMPTPKPVLDLEKRNPEAGAVAAYEEKLGNDLKKYIDEARTHWDEVVRLAKQSGVSNRWSQLALENLGREFPDEYVVLHQELFDGTEAP